MFQSPDSGANASTPSLVYSPTPRPEPQFEPLRHMVFGSAIAVRKTIALLHRLNYAEPHEWSKLIPTERENEVMAVLTKKVRIS